MFIFQINPLVGPAASKSSMAESRHFPNPYPPTLQGERAKILDDSKNQVCSESLSLSIPLPSLSPPLFLHLPFTATSPLFLIFYTE